MDALLQSWYQEAGIRRGAQRPGWALAPTLLGDAEPRTETSIAAARAMLELLGGRAVRLGLQPGSSSANLKTGEVVLDRRILDGEDPWPLKTERLLGVAAHEAGHLRWTPVRPMPQDVLFRTIQNVLEDERIEARLAESHEALGFPLRAARRDLLTAAGPDAPFLWAVFTLIRCEQPLHPKLWARYGDRLRSVIEALTPFPQSFEEVRRASLTIALQIPPDEREMLPDPEIFDLVIEASEDDLDLELEGRSWAERIRCRRRRRGKRPDPRLAPDSGPITSWPPIVFSQAEAAPEGYAQVQAEVKARAGALANRLRSLLPARPAARQNSGRLDRKRLHAHAYSPRIFRSAGSQPPSLSIAILTDLSSSMSGRSEKIAQQVAVLLSEAARTLPEVQLAVYGHSADLDREANTQLVHFPLDADGRPLGLGRLPVRGNNRDSEGIRAMGAELLASPLRGSQHRIAILIADGAPSARDYHGNEAIRQTRDAIVWLDQVWGPVLFIATDEVEILREMVPGASFRFRAGDAVEELARNLTVTLKRSKRGA
jgi:hypothetical protein